ncbi:MAG: hypothetical protein DBY17_00455 [Oscillospiraceae bacterium]|nr:MAG: hypothetical protein DBY17_00455 [Oscillospiraceae bacterium]
MTEHEFDQKVEAAAQRFEQRVEHAAAKLDNGLNSAWNCSRVFRTVSRSASFAAGAGLLLAGRHLAGQGRGAAAACCFALGAAGLSAELAVLIFLRRK